MTAEQVIALADRKAREAGETWALDGVEIRSPGCRCPLEVAADMPRYDYHHAARWLDVKPDDQWRIIFSADNKTWEAQFDPALRALMLATFDFGAEDGNDA